MDGGAATGDSVVAAAVRVDDVVDGADFVKVDVEGFEPFAISGAARLLDGPARPRMLFLEHCRRIVEQRGVDPVAHLRLLQAGGYRLLFYDKEESEQQWFPTHRIIFFLSAFGMKMKEEFGVVR